MAERRKTERLSDIGKKCSTDRKLLRQFAEVLKISAKPGAYASVYTPEVLYVFRCDGILEIMSDRARMLAESLYLIHRAKYRRHSRRPSRYLCVVTPEAAALIRTVDLKDYYLISKTPDYDWDLEPANPDGKLVRDLQQLPAVRQAAIYHWENPAEEEAFLDRLALCQAEEQMTLFADASQGGDDYPVAGETQRASVAQDPSAGPGMEEGKEPEAAGRTDRNRHGYDREALYLDRVMGRAVDESRLQLTGEFYTPLPFAEKAMVYLGRVIGPQWWTTGRYRLWDMAAGTGNLEYVLPPEAQRYCYLSTLSEEETAYCQTMFPGATVFQYDYLNDDVDFMEYAGLEAMGVRKKLPAGLQADLENPRLRWILLLNPPYSGEREGGKTAAQESLPGGEKPGAGQAERAPDRECAGAGREEPDQTQTESLPISYGKRTWATTTKIQQLMMAEGLGWASRDLSSQFLYRIHRDFAGKEAYLGLLSRLGYLTAAHNEGIRDAFFRYRFEKGFLFSSMNFKGCKHKFPYGFLVWNLNTEIPLEEQEITVDIYNRAVEKVDTISVIPGKQLKNL